MSESISNQIDEAAGQVKELLRAAENGAVTKPDDLVEIYKLADKMIRAGNRASRFKSGLSGMPRNVPLRSYR